MIDGQGADVSARKSNWGRWGESDEKGALNLLTQETVLAALRIPPRTGKRYSLGIPIQRSGVPNMEYRGTPAAADDDQSQRRGDGAGERRRSRCRAHEDQLIMPSHTSTHMDALCHVYSENKIYNGHPP